MLLNLVDNVTYPNISSTDHVHQYQIVTNSVSFFLESMFQTIAAKVQASLAKANQVATETFSCMKTVRSFANEDGETERYRLQLDDTYALNKKEAAAYAASTWANSVSYIKRAMVSYMFINAVLLM